MTKLNQAELARRLGVSAAQLTRILNGERRPSIAVAKGIEVHTGFQWRYIRCATCDGTGLRPAIMKNVPVHRLFNGRKRTA